VKRTILLTAFLSLIAICLTSCGTAYNLRTVQLTAPSTNLQGIGGIIQLQVMGTYTYGPNKDLTFLPGVTYTIIVDPDQPNSPNGPLLAPPQTVTVSTTGLVTAVEPAVCTWEEVGTPTQAAWAIMGDYKITATYRGVTSQPVYIAVASAAGPSGPPGNGACGPSTSGG
jgi:hypothetical protein